MNQTPADSYRNTSQIYYTLLVFAAVPAVILATIFVSDMIEDEVWSVVAAIFTFLFTTGLAMAQFDRLKARRTDGEYALRFPGYAGARYPIFYLLRYEDAKTAIDFTKPDMVYSLGEADECLFVMEHKRPDDISAMSPGKLVQHPKTFRPLALRLPDIVDVAVVERSDEEIAGSAVDTRDFAERFGSQIAERLTGTSVKTKIIPYAAYIAITARGDEGDAFLLAAIPTTVDAQTLTAMGELTKETDFETPWLVEKGIAGAGRVAVAEIDSRAADLVDTDTMEMVHGGVDTLGAAGEAVSWLNPDAAEIATTAGARGRRMAQLIGLRIRRRAGLIAPAETHPNS